MSIIKEGNAKIKAELPEVVSKEMDVFYNPVMKFNRDVSVLLLNAVGGSKQIGLPLSGSGIRGIRFLLELDDGIVKNLSFNDYDKNAQKNILGNIEMNGLLTNELWSISSKDANEFLLDSTGFDYIDIDPFGSPNPFLDSAAKRISRGGILAVTATDTAPLCGTYPRTCLRKYWAVPMRTHEMHEAGLRILIRKVQLVGAQYDKALVPVFSYFKDHYFRVFFRCDKGKMKVDSLLKEHDFYNDSGPMWLGSLCDKKLVGKIAKQNEEVKNQKFLDMLVDEMDVVGFFDIHKLCKKHKMKILSNEEIFARLKKAGIKFSRTHFLDTGIKANLSEEELVGYLK